MSSIGIALSGGGYRATTWALGALLYLVDAGKNAEVRSISSVSGGSIANGFVAHELDYRTTRPEAFRSAIRPMLDHVASEGLFFFGRPTNGYVISFLTAVVVFVGAVAAWVVGVALVVFDVIGTPGWLAAMTVALLVLGGIVYILFSWRSRVVDRALAKQFFSREGDSTRLAELVRSVEHVFCATELQSGDHFYFAPEFVYGYRHGVGDPGDLRVSTAVQCSACLPGAFRPRKLPAGKHAFRRFAHARPPEAAPKHLLLYDGGVYDNMADQWHQGLEPRRRRWEEIAVDGGAPPAIQDVDELVVVNASAGWEWQPLKWWEHLAGEIAGVLRAKSVLYDATTAHRRQGLVGRFDRAALQGEGLRGALVHIPQSPWVTAERLARSSGAFAERAQRARIVLDRLAAASMDKREWGEVASADAGVGTVLSALTPETTARLLHHSYVLSMCNLHIVLDYPLLPIPDRAAFEALVS